MSEMSQDFHSYWNSTFVTVIAYEVVDNLFERVRSYTKEAVEHLIVAAIIYSVLCVLLYACIARWHVFTFNGDVKKHRRVLFVIAHPDDECMFFGPTILHFTSDKNVLVYLLCLSTGANYGMGKTRKKELYKACQELGIDEGCVIIQKHCLLPDAIDVKWPTELVADLIIHTVEQYSIDTLISFDRHGVSQHLNHCSIYFAIAYLLTERKMREDCTVYVLESVNFIRKYWLILDIPLSYVLSRNRFILSNGGRTVVLKAMKQHKSQLLWFRCLYLLFSRYIIINTLQEMDITDIELDLEVED